MTAATSHLEAHFCSSQISCSKLFTVNSLSNLRVDITQISNGHTALLLVQIPSKYRRFLYGIFKDPCTAKQVTAITANLNISLQLQKLHINIRVKTKTKPCVLIEIQRQSLLQLSIFPVARCQ